MATVGVDMGGTKCLGIALVDGHTAAESRLPTPRGEKALLDTVSTLVESLAAEVGERVTALGVGVPGLVDRDGVLRFAPNLPGVTGWPVRSDLEEAMGVPVRVDNDATCAAWGERQLGAAHGFDEVVLVTLGTGIGGGIVAGGRIHRGANGFAGEVGHMVVDPHGPPCPCGQRGCWERFASGSGLGRLAREAAEAGKADRVVALAGGDPESVRGEHVSAAIAEGDAEACRIMDSFAWWLALGLVNLTNIFDPQAFVIGGGLVAAGPALFDPAREAFADLIAGRDFRPPVPILPADLGPQAGAIGAAFLALAHEQEQGPERPSERSGGPERPSEREITGPERPSEREA
ncbi:MAG: ROK family protein [Acidimicrobiales bacterium]